MKKLLKFLLSSKFKTQKRPQKKGGFTLIELLVGLALAFLIITPLLGFVVNTMTSDRQEQAKAASEQEIQTALDYISRDVSQAIFIYDGLGVQSLVSNSSLPKPSGDSTPVLVFWKREIKPRELLPAPNNTNDAFVLSLVAYYLIKDTACNSTSAWSCTARIGRVQMDEAVPDPTDATKTILEAIPRGFTTPYATATTAPIAGAPAQTTTQKINNWTPTGADLNSVQVQTLIDYVDQTTVENNPSPTVTPCSTGPRSDRPDLNNPSPTDLAADYLYRQTPNYNGAGVPTSLKTGSFYACVSSDANGNQSLAQVFIRGNAVARIKPKNNPPTYSPSQTAYFPKASIQVQGRGLISEN
jgi:type II secretory pathway component PulJ